MNKYFTTKEVAGYLHVNEKMIYTLVSEKGLPASKVTGKWIFPQHLVDQWMDANTINTVPRIGTTQCRRAFNHQAAATIPCWNRP